MSTATLRPSRSLGSSGGVTVTGAGSFHAATSDDSDASYVTIPAGGDFSVGFTAPVTIPSGAVLKSVVQRVRINPQATPETMGIEFGYAEGYNGQTDWVTTNLATGLQDRTGPNWAPAGGTGYILTVGPKVSIQNDLDNLTFNTWVWSGSAGALRVMEVYADLRFALPPVTTVTSPAGAIGTTTTSTVFTYAMADADGSSQTAFRVKVFSSGQYSAPGFSPVSSTAVYDSGIVYSSALTHAIPTTLQDATSYRCYVQVAQTTNAVVQWSEWAYSSFNVAIAPASLPGTPTVTATGQDTYGRIKVLVAQAVVDGDYFEVQRSVDAGATWLAVASLPFSGGGAVFYDYDVPADVVAFYRAKAVDVVGVNVYSGSWSLEDSASWTPPPPDPASPASGTAFAWLKHPVNTQLNTRVTLEFGSFTSITRRANRGVYDVIGRANAVVVTDVRRSREGEFTIIICDDVADPAADAARILDLLKADSVLKLEPDPVTGIDILWFSAGDVEEVRPVSSLDHAARAFRVPYTETEAPSTEVTIEAATWATVVDTYANWSAVVAGQATWADLIGLIP